MRRVRTLWVYALKGSARAYRKLGIYYQKAIFEKDRILAKACLEKAMELGDENAFFLYHRWFPTGKKVIDDDSYEKIWSEYCQAKNKAEQVRLKKYLHLGTKEQREWMKNKKRCGYDEELIQ